MKLPQENKPGAVEFNRLPAQHNIFKWWQSSEYRRVMSNAYDGSSKPTERMLVYYRLYSVLVFLPDPEPGVHAILPP